MKKNLPKVGIALLAYNQGRYVDDAIDSLKKQSFQDFEIILADDGSSDGYTPEKLKRIRYKKIKKKIIDGKNLGNAKRRRNLYTQIDNKYVMDFSADDVLDADFLLKTVSFLDKHDKYGAVSTNIVYFKDDPHNGYYVEQYDKDKMNLENLLINNRVLGSSLMRNNALKELDLSGGFARYQDWDRWVTMTEAGWKIGLIDEPLFFYRFNEDSLSHSATIEQELEIRKQLLKKHDIVYRQKYKEVILGLDRRRLEIEQSKGRLEKEYRKALHEIEKLNKQTKELDGVIREYQGIIKSLRGAEQKSYIRRIKDKVRRHTHM